MSGAARRGGRQRQSSTRGRPRQPATIPSEVFLSHAGADRRFADRLVEVLRRHRVPVWYSTTSLVGAQRWHDEIGEALARCDWFVLVLSRASERSEWVKRELQYALINTDRYADRIVPLRKGSCNTERLSWVLDSLQYVDFGQAFDDGCRALLRIWGIGFVPNNAGRSGRKRPARARSSQRGSS